MFKYVIAVLLFCCTYSSTSLALPVEAFGSLPDITQVALSPNGEQVSAIVRINLPNTKGTAVQVTNLKTGDKKFAVFTDNKKYDFYWVRWKDDKTLLVGLMFPEKRDLTLGFSSFRSKTRETRLMIVDLETNETFTPFSNAFIAKYKFAPVNEDNVVDILPDEPDTFLMALPTDQTLAFGNNSYEGVYKVNFRKHSVHLEQGSEENVYDWWADQQHHIRAGFFYENTSGIRKIVFKNTQDTKWQAQWPHKLFSEESVTPIGFGADPNTLYVHAYHEKRLAVFKVNLADKDLKKELVYSDPVYDVNGGLIYSSVTHDVVGVSYSARGGAVFFDPELKKLQASIDRALPDTTNVIYSFSKDMQSFVLFSSSDINSGTYYIGHRNPIKLEAFAYHYKQLPSSLMAPVKRYDYKARDGLAIEAYLTLPKNSLGKNLPTIIFPHGGPISRDDDSFDYWAQFLADKGYAVLKMNFRGSAGQGLEFRNAGLKNWGMEMQDDIEDGARKLIADGISDAKSICILGASYGGYAALMGAVKTPDVYKCAVSVAGVSNVYEMVKDSRDVWSSYNTIDEQIGNDYKHLHEISPVNYADKIKIPVLLVHGDSDRQVDIKHSVQMYDALKKAGKDVTFVTLPDEDHYLMNNENRVTTFKAMDEFLNKNLPVAH